MGAWQTEARGLLCPREYVGSGVSSWPQLFTWKMGVSDCSSQRGERIHHLWQVVSLS